MLRRQWVFLQLRVQKCICFRNGFFIHAFMTRMCQMTDDADPSPQDLLLWPQYTHTQGLQKSCGGKGTAQPLPPEESIPTLALTGFYCFSRPLYIKDGPPLLCKGLFWVVIFCRQRRGCCWIHQRRIFAIEKEKWSKRLVPHVEGLAQILGR